MDGTNVYFTETHLKDHLGNTRVVFGRQNNALVIKQVNSYYPFGMNIRGLSTYIPPLSVDSRYPPNEYLYNGKMFQDELGLDWLDYGARMYDAVLGRWHGVDPLAEVSTRWSPYNYGYNNPIRFVDPDGMLSQSFMDEIWKSSGSNTTTWHNNNDGTFTSTNGKTASTGEEGTQDPKDPPKSRYQLAGEGWAQGYSISGGGFGAAMDGRDPYNPTKADEEESAEALMMVVSMYTGGYITKQVFINLVRLYKVAKAANMVRKLAIYPDVIIKGGRSGQLLKNATGPANAVVKGSEGRIYITNQQGQVIWDITKERVKSVIPGQGFGDKVLPTKEQLDLILKLWGN